MQFRGRSTGAAIRAASITTAAAALAALALASPAAAAPATTFTPGEGTGTAWCPGYGGVSLGSYHDVYACAPKTKTAGRTPFDSYAGFQCTELANRFLYTVTGRTLFDNEEGGNFAALAAAAYSIGLASSGPPGVLPRAGDIISMWGGRSKQKQDGGRTEVAVVTKVTATATGWTITTLNQGDPSDTDGARGFNTIAVSANGSKWSALDGFYADFDWLKLAGGRGTGDTGSPPGPGAWRASEAPLPGSAQTGSLLAVACGSAATCTAVGSSAGAAMLIYRTGARWIAASTPIPASSGSNAQLTTITCPAAASCLAAGDYRSAGRQQGMLLAGHGASWTATSAPLPASAAAQPQAVLSSAACPAVASCVVAGRLTAANGSTYGLLLIGHGSSWTGTRAPVPADAASRPQAELMSVACPAAGHCVAVGSYLDKAGNEQGLIVAQTPGGWAAIRAALPVSAVTPGAALDTVSCPATGVCEAAGTFNGNRRGMILTGAGSTWSAIATPLPGKPAGRGTTSFRQILCLSVTACLAVGGYADGSDSYQGLVVTGHGSVWRAARAPLPADAAASQGQPGARLITVACSAPTACVAAGQYTDTAGDARLLLLTLRGTTWHAVGGPLPGNDRTVGAQAQGALTAPSLTSVACPAATGCVAVGSYPARQPGMEGLVETGTF